MWSDRRLTGRRLSEMTWVELVRTGISVYGRPPSAFFRDASSAAALRRAVHAELVGYWQGAVDQPSMWLSDWCVDLGLVTIVRADAALREDRLITKREAIERLNRYGVPESLAQEIRQRRDGLSVPRSLLDRARRGWTARRLVARAISDLTVAHPPVDATPRAG
jgi:hypothetical protein